MATERGGAGYGGRSKSTFHLKHFDYIIVGQGIAGTMLDFFLRQHGCTVGVIDDAYPRAASQVAAGLINPVTGRRYVKSWRIDELLPVARQTYRALEEQLGVSIYQELNVIRSLFNHREENDWLARTGEPGYEPYMLEETDLGPYGELTEPVFSYGEVRQCAQVDLAGLTRAYRARLADEERLKEAAFNYEQLEVVGEEITYQDWRANAVIFCEGAKGIHNPFFNYLPYRGAKGEVLIVHIPGAGFEKAFKHRVFIIPMGAERYWIGATYDWKYADDSPTEAGRSFLEEHLQDILKTPFKVLKHQAAIRPTVKDRRPFLGRHPHYTNLVLFNGLGTKGTSLAPFWARHLVEYLLDDQPLDPAVDIGRF